MSDRRGPNDYLALGDWNARCDRCGKKMKGSQLRLTWQGWWVCPEHWEPRQPQDFVRTIVENPTPPFVRNPADVFIAVCSPDGMTAIVDYATVDCVIVDYIAPGFDPTINLEI